MAARFRRFRLAAGLLSALALLVASLAAWKWLDRRVATLASPESLRRHSVRELSFRPVIGFDRPLDMIGDGTVRAVVHKDGDLWTGGGSGLSTPSGILTPASGLPSLRVASVAVWRNGLVFSFEAGGWGRITPEGPEVASTGFGTLSVRSMAESEAGDLFLAAAQGLFKSAYGTNEIQKLSEISFRTVLVLPGGSILAGGENGLYLFQEGSASPDAIPAPDPWIESMAFDGKNVWVATAGGIAFGPLEGRQISLSTHPRGFEFSSGVLWKGQWVVPASGKAPFLVTLGADGSAGEVPVPEPFRQVFTSSGQVLGDGPSGIHARMEDGTWRVMRERSAISLPLPHVNAMAVRDKDAWLGFFDGPAVRFEDLKTIKPPDSTEPWGVNSLLSAGGAVYAATLRGAYRLTGGPVEKLPGPGAAFSLTDSPEGVIAGYGGGVLFPGPRLLSAFHGLPGNQAYALSAGKEPGTIWVGTPSGLGRLENRKVTLRVARGEGKLPHPWVTALKETETGLWVATYGGGVVRVTSAGTATSWSQFPETGGLKVNAGAIAETPSGDVIFGTQGQGMWGLQSGHTEFERLRIPLPSSNVFSLALYPATSSTTLLVGTDEGLALVLVSELFHR